MASLEELRDHARLTYRYWPIYLVLRLRELEQHLPTDQRPHSLGTGAHDMSLLREVGLWTHPTLSSFTPPPPLTIPDRADLCFEVETGSISADLIALAQSPDDVHRLDLMRVPSDHADTLHHAADRLSRILDPATALAAARTWAALHGARPLDWQRVTTQHTPASPVHYPTRRRGKGLFRTPR